MLDWFTGWEEITDNGKGIAGEGIGQPMGERDHRVF